VTLEAEVPAFGLAPYQRGGPSSFTRGGEGSLLYFWEDPRDSKSYLVATQAPYVIRRIQRAFGADVDGKYGSATANSIIRAMRADGQQNADPTTEATPGVLAYALLRSKHGGTGRIAFPSGTQFPSVDHAALAPGSSTAIRVVDVSTGRDVSIVPVSANEWQPLRPEEAATPATPATPDPSVTVRTGIVPGPDGEFGQVSACGTVSCPVPRWEDPSTYPRATTSRVIEVAILGFLPPTLLLAGAAVGAGAR
jgi:hypothetical protein